MTLAQSIIIATIVAYLGAMLLIGLYFSRKGSADSSDEFYIGGRSLGPIVTAMSAEASDMSSYLLMGLPGLAYISGVAECGWTIIGLAGGMKAASVTQSLSIRPRFVTHSPSRAA